MITTLKLFCFLNWKNNTYFFHFFILSSLEHLISTVKLYNINWWFKLYHISIWTTCMTIIPHIFFMSHRDDELVFFLSIRPFAWLHRNGGEFFTNQGVNIFILKKTYYSLWTSNGAPYIYNGNERHLILTKIFVLTLDNFLSHTF